MRSFLIVFGTALVVAAAFAIYWALQPKTRAQVTTTAPVIPTGNVVQSGGSGLGDGQRPWVFSYDGGILKSQFTAANYRPQPDRSIQVDRPVTVFYLGGGKMVVVTGDTGVLDPPPGGAPQSGSASSPMPGTMSMTSRNGRLHAVVINAYPTTTSLVPTMTIVTDNIRYDSDTLQLFTDKYTDAAGHVVPADQVPVTERGDDYDFDGKGLTIRWNGKTHRMQQLKVAHGEKLVVKHPSHMGLPGNADAKTTANAAETPVLRYSEGPGLFAGVPALGRTYEPAFARPTGAMLASTDRAAVLLVAATTTTPAAKPVYHRAIFNDDVRVFQGAHKSAVADMMLADFVDRGSGDDSNKTTGPAATGPAVLNQPFIPPTTYSAPPAALKAAALPYGASTQPAPAVMPIPAPVATSQPTKGPITITWTGELSVSELDTEPMMPLVSGQSVVRLVGSPTVLTPVGSTVTAARATYRTGDGALLAEPSAKVPEVVLVQDKGVTLHAKLVSFDPATSVATLGGVSRLDVPQKKGLPMVVTWDRIGLLHVADKPPAAPGEHGDPGAGPELGAVDAVDLSGHVAVDRPSFSMRAQKLHLELEPVPGQDAKKKSDVDSPATAPKRMLATGDVRARFTGTGGKTQGIDADKLDVRMDLDPAGKSFPNGVRADGNVVAMDTDQTMTAKHLEAVLAERAPTAPATVATTAPADDDPAAAVDLVSMLSTGDVHAVTKAGATADSQNLRVTTVDGVRQVELWGNGGAVVKDGKGKTLTGSVLHLSPDRGTASVDGAGTIHSVGSASGGANPQSAAPTTRPADVSWTDSMSLDSARNSVEVVGHVEVKIVEADGGISIFTGDRAHLDLEDAPKKSADDSAVAEDDTAQSVMGSKQVKRLIMNGHVVGDSLLSANGQVVRQGHLTGNKLIYTTIDGRAEIPGPGQLLIVNHKPAETPAAGTPDAAAAGEKSGGHRGSMAVAWTHSLIYSDALNQIDITGGVRAGFSPDAGAVTDKAPRDTTPMRLETDELLITLKKTAPPEAASAKPKPADNDQSRMQIEKATAIGAVHFIAHGGDVWCHTADFDPTGDRMTARGSDAEPGHASQLPGKTGAAFDGTFTELVFDTSSEEVVSVKGMGGVMRK
jgi:hypothetical protein